MGDLPAMSGGFGNFGWEVSQNLLWEVHTGAIQSFPKLSP
jgi:hypothetical protein